MKIEKDGIIKDVADNIVADYKSAGWKIYEEPKKDNKSKKVEMKDKEIDGE